MLPYTDPVVIDLLASVSSEKRTDSWWLILRDGTPIPGNGGGGVTLLKEVQMTRWLGRLLATVRLSPIVDTLDHFVAHQRGRLSRFVLNGSALRRYP